jgi:adenosylcobyric acid synthase
MGRTVPTRPCEPLHRVADANGQREEGAKVGNVWGTYLHGWFEAPEVRQRVISAAGISGYRRCPILWPEQRRKIYDAMAEHLTTNVNLEPIRRYLGM